MRNTWKALTKVEAQNISSFGLYIVSIWEDGPANEPSYFSYTQGKNDGKAAFDFAANLGQVTNTPVYFAVDFDATLSNKQSILDYFNGVKSGYLRYLHDHHEFGLPEIYYKIGVYGSYDVLGWCNNQGITTYYFQAYATGWSGGRNANQWNGAQLRQISSDQNLCGIMINLDTSNGAGGGWKY